MIAITYTTSAYTPAGWRAVTITAEGELLSPKRVKVARVTDVNGDGVVGYASISGARRQTYSVGGVAAREVGKTKLVSSCRVS